MHVTERHRFSTLRYLAFVAAGALLLSLLPLTGTAFGQDDGEPDDVDEPLDACPEDPPAAPYEDRDDIPPVHVRNVDCVTHRDIAEGFADNTFRPALSVRRDQMTSFIARTVEEAGFTLPAATEHEGFADTAGNTHEDRIKQLAAAGIVEGGPEELDATHFGPERRVRRDQMASFLMRAAEWAFEQDLGSDDQQFTDVPAGNVHFENVNAAAEFDLALGGPGQLPDTQFGPSLHTRRDQMASFLSRLLAFLEDPPDTIGVDPQTLELGPAAAVNPVGTEHTVTATVTGADDAAIAPQVDVRFEVYRDATIDGETVTLGEPVEEGTETTTDGAAAFTYTGPDDPANDLIVACVADGDNGEDCAFVPTVDDGDIQGDFEGDQVGGTATKTWVPVGAPTALTLDPAAAVNEVGTEHTVTAGVTGVDGTDIDPQVDVRFEVYRDATIDGETVTLGEPVAEGTETTTDGAAAFTYTGPDDPANDLIVACVADECTFTPTVDDGEIIADFDGDQVGGTATKTWAPVGAPTALTLAPAADLNDVGTDHTVTADVTGVDGTDIDPQVDVRFEVYRDATIDGDTVTLGEPVAEDTVTTEDGEAVFTYTGPDDPAEDIIVACVVDDEVTACQFVPAVDNGDIVADFDGDQVGGTATKTWFDPGAPTALTLDPAAAVNDTGTDHTVTADVTIFDGSPVDQADVRFEVYRDATIDGDTVTLGEPVEEETVTTQDGSAAFTYTGPADAAHDLIVACVTDDDNGEDCAFVPTVDDGDIVGDFEGGQVGGTATKTWVPIGAPAALTLDPPAGVNDTGTDHTVTATVTAADDEALDPEVRVRFNLYRDPVVDNGDVTLSDPIDEDIVTTTDGTATFTYTGPDDPAEDIIVACVVDDVEDCQFVATPGDDGIDIEFEGDQVGGTATKTWLPAGLP